MVKGITIPALAPGRKFLCVGPHCWGSGATAEEAIKNAKSNRVKVYEGKAGWRYILFDAAADTYVNQMGDLCYVPVEGVEPYREILRYRMEAEKK